MRGLLIAAAIALSALSPAAMAEPAAELLGALPNAVKTGLAPLFSGNAIGQAGLNGQLQGTPDSPEAAGRADLGWIWLDLESGGSGSGHVPLGGSGTSLHAPGEPAEEFPSWWSHRAAQNGPWAPGTLPPFRIP